jgi:hypothetical protein
MPRSKNPESYPPELKQLLDATVGNPEGINITFESKSELMKQRSLFYAYINALDKHEVENKVPYSLCVSADYRKIQFTYTNLTLRMLDKKFTPGILAMRAALAALPNAPSESPADETRRKALEEIERSTSAQAPDAGYKS